MRPSSLPAAACAALIFATGAQAQSVQASPPAVGQAVDLQGNPGAFVNNPHVHAFYDLSVAMLRPGAPKLDMKVYEAKSFAIFRAMGAAMGSSPEAMQEHLKLIPRQMVQIAKEDPSVLDSFEAFTTALVGPT